MQGRLSNGRQHRISLSCEAVDEFLGYLLVDPDFSERADEGLEAADAVCEVAFEGERLDFGDGFVALGH